MVDEGAYTMKRTRRRWKVGKNRWKARQEIICMNEDGAGLEATLWNEAFPGMSGGDAPLCLDVEIQEDFRPGRSRVIASYETPRSAGRGHAHARVTLGTTSIQLDLAKAMTDEFGEAWKYVAESGLTEAEKAKYFWRPKDLTTVVYQKPLLKLTLETAYQSDTWLEEGILDLYRHANDAPVEALWAHEPGQLLLTDVRSVHSFNPTDLVYMDMDFVLNPDIWPESVEVELWEKVAIEEQVLDDDLITKTSDTVWVHKYVQYPVEVVKTLPRYPRGDLTTLVSYGELEW